MNISCSIDVGINNAVYIGTEIYKDYRSSGLLLQLCSLSCLNMTEGSFRFLERCRLLKKGLILLQ